MQKNKIIKIGPLNSQLICFGPSNDYYQGPPLHTTPSIRDYKGRELLRSILLPPFQNIRCFSFVKQMYLDIFLCVGSLECTH
jgi:hypothetical protein